MAVMWKVEDDAVRVLRERQAFRACVAALACSPSSHDLDASELIYGELVGNAMRHAGGGPVEARVELDDDHPPVLVVRDHGPGVERTQREEPSDQYAESGRGLRIVEVLARELAVDKAGDGGTVVRATLPVTPRAHASTSC